MVPIVPLEELVGNCGISMASGSGGATLPSPGAFVTPQAGQLGETSITRFFDPSTYRGKTMGLPPLGPRETMHELTQENINRFFDQTTYHGKMVELPPMGPSLVMPGLKKHDVQHLFDASTHRGQKRPSETPPQHPAAKARLGKIELLEKFKQAATLNGISWEELMVP